MANLSCLSYPRNNKKEKTDLVMQKSSKIKNTYPCIYCKKKNYPHQRSSKWQRMKLDNQLPRCPAASSMKLPAPRNSAKNSRPGATTGIGMTKSLRNKQNMACVHKHIYIYAYVRTYVTLHYITVQYSTVHYVTLRYITLHTYITYIYSKTHHIQETVPR